MCFWKARKKRWREGRERGREGGRAGNSVKIKSNDCL